MALLKKDKQEKVALNLQDPNNRKMAIKASLDYKIPMVYMGEGIFVLNLKRVKEDNVRSFFKQFTGDAATHIKSAIFRDDPKCDFLIIYDEVPEV